MTKKKLPLPPPELRAYLGDGVEARICDDGSVVIQTKALRTSNRIFLSLKALVALREFADSAEERIKLYETKCKLRERDRAQ